jgi:hypothetical protein
MYRCLDSILHAEHKTILEEMRSDYHLTNELQTHDEDEDPLVPETQVVANGIIQTGNGKVYQDIPLQPEKSMLSDYALNLGTLLRSLDRTPSNDYDRVSRFVCSKQRPFRSFLINALL